MAMGLVAFYRGAGQDAYLQTGKVTVNSQLLSLPWRSQIDAVYLHSCSDSELTKATVLASGECLHCVLGTVGR